MQKATAMTVRYVRFNNGEVVRMYVDESIEGATYQLLDDDSPEALQCASTAAQNAQVAWSDLRQIYIRATLDEISKIELMKGFLDKPTPTIDKRLTHCQNYVRQLMDLTYTPNDALPVLEKAAY